MLGLLLNAPVLAADDKANSTPMTLSTNVNALDDKNDRLARAISLLVEADEIAKIAKSIPAPKGAKVIDGGGWPLMLGLIDAHTHRYWNVSATALFFPPEKHLHALTLKEAEASLLAAFGRFARS